MTATENRASTPLSLERQVRLVTGATVLVLPCNRPSNAVDIEASLARIGGAGA